MIDFLRVLGKDFICGTASLRGILSAYKVTQTSKQLSLPVVIEF